MEDLVLDLPGDAHSARGRCLSVQDEQIELAPIDLGDHARLRGAFDIDDLGQLRSRPLAERQQYRVTN